MCVVHTFGLEGFEFGSAMSYQFGKVISGLKLMLAIVS